MLGVGELAECVGDELVASEGGALCEAVLGVAAGPEGGDGFAALLDEAARSGCCCASRWPRSTAAGSVSPYPCPVQREGLHDGPHQHPVPGGEQTREGVV